MENPYESKPAPEERSSVGVGCGCLAVAGIAFILIVGLAGGLMLYRMQTRAAVMREEAMRARMEAERAKDEAARAKADAEAAMSQPPAHGEARGPTEGTP